MLKLNEIYNEDCLTGMKKIDDKSIDMILCDLPYGITACEWDIVPDLEKLWMELKRIGKDNCAYVFTASQPFTTDLINSNREWFKYEWIWDKVSGANFMNLKNRPLKTHENVLVFAKTASFIFNPIKVLRTEKSLMRDKACTSVKRKINSKSTVEHYGNTRQRDYLTLDAGGMKHPIDVLHFTIYEKGRYEVKHPTKKPVALFEYLIKTYTNEGDVVFDGFLGSGTTAVACINTNRNYLGFEISKEYCAIAEKRIKEAKMQLKLF